LQQTIWERISIFIASGEKIMNIALIRELNADHAVLMRAVDAIHTAGGYSNDVRDLLIKVRSALVRHLDKEEQHFYPVMREAAEKNMDLNNLLTVMGLEMEQIANKALGLIEGWLEKDGGDAFTDEFDSFRTILASRISREEKTLYSKYLKLAGS